MLELININKNYNPGSVNELCLFKDFNLTVKDGEFVSVVGSNGSGKTSMLNIICGSIAVDSGKILIHGEDITRQKEYIRQRRIGRVYQDPSKGTCPGMTILENMSIAENKGKPYNLGRGVNKAKLEEYREMLRPLNLGLEDKMGVQVGSLSGGQRQRIGIARALYNDPEVLILDEPTSFLDIRHKLELLAIPKKMVLEKQMTVIMSLHELDLAQKISDQVICVHGDHIEKYGAPEEIFTSDYIRKLYGITRGSYNAEFGCVEMEPPAGEPRVFVIGGNGSGIPVYRKLQRQGIPFATGVLHTNDADYQVAKELAARVITEKPFECISQESFQGALEIMEKCREVYCPLKDFGTMNKKNLELFKKAEKSGKLKQI